ncbi:MAG: hypothetical protein U9Q34_07975 [Elusimicrobiota bacterium]|nr:hypothetical protein [Elusimicrobiota bacterium]
MKKIIFLILFLPFVLIQSSAAFQENKPLSLELEYFAPDETASNVDSIGALGLRFTYLHPISDSMELGGSLGYIMGPNAEYKTGLSGGSSDWERDMNFVRVLGEFKIGIPISDNWIFKPGLSAGMAFGNISYSGARTGSDSWSGFAWEVSVPFIYKNYIFSAKYAGFPTGSSSDEWNTFGFSAGYRFGLGGGGYDSGYKYDETRAKKSFEQQEFVEEKEAPIIPTETYESYVEQADFFFDQGSYMEAAGKYSGALIFLEPDDPRRIYILERQGTALGKQEKFKEGIDFYMKAIGVGKSLNIVDRNVINAYLGLSYCQTRIGNLPWAMINYKSARELTKSESLKLKIDEVLEGLKKELAEKGE